MLAVVVAGAVTLAVVQPWRASAAAKQPDAAANAATVPVERTTLIADLTLNGTLSYGDTIDLPGRPGLITGLPKAGDEIAVGHEIYEVDGQPVIAVQGARPFWRPLAQGVPDGPDVKQLEQFLANAGFGAGLTVDDKFTSTTTARVKQWQKALGVAQTGVVDLGDIVAVPDASLRISAVTAKLGDQAQASPLSYTSTQLQVVATLTDAQSRELLPATPVTVTLPAGTALAAKIRSIDPGGVPTGTGADAKTTTPSATITLDDPAKATGIGLRAVKVTLAASQAKDAIVVPVTALIATLDGGYAVDVVRKGKAVRVAVKLGLIADTRVQVVSGDLTAGERVVVGN